MKNKNLGKLVYTIILGFALIAFWRGVWGILDLYLFPSKPLISFIISILIGIITIYLAKHHLADRLV